MTNKELATNYKKAIIAIDEDVDNKAKWEHFEEAFNKDPIWRVFELAHYWDNDLDDWCDEMLNS